MKLYAPQYYKDFICIADKCRHSCCIGWEIDIDADTYAYYKQVPGQFGARLRACIAEEDSAPHFALDTRERCPFLNESGLCDVITQLGEGALCQICADHPRYRNFYEGRTEIGLGLCCEAAAELILSRTEKMELVVLEDDLEIELPDPTEEWFFSFRAKLFDLFQDRSMSVMERINAFLAEFGFGIKDKTMEEWTSFYRSLEVLDEAWTQRLLAYEPNKYTVPDTMQEQLLCYFLYRHMADGMYDDTLTERVCFALHATAFICALAKDEKDVYEIARMYSAEIEYSEENIEKILDAVAQGIKKEV